MSKTNTCALDVGAHWGEVGLDYARLHSDIPVYAFEPDILTDLQS
jgi:precorrin-6B methylase 2